MDKINKLLKDCKVDPAHKIDTYTDGYWELNELISHCLELEQVKTLGLFSVINWVDVKAQLPPKHIYIMTYDDRGQQDMMFVH